MNIGFFDSGLGGLLMMESCIKNNPYHKYYYIGDTLNLPYGPKSPELILDCMEAYLLWLFEDKKCDYICIACNTASVKALPLFLEKYPNYQNKFIDIIVPTAEFLSSSDEAILVLATQGTVASNRYQQGDHIYQVAMPGLVELIEAHKISEALVMVDDVLAYYPNIHRVLLACTHYIFLKDALEKKYPNHIFYTQDNYINSTIKKFNGDSLEATPEYYLSRDSKDYSIKYEKEFNHLHL